MEYYIGEIRPFAFKMVPKNWLACDGQILPITEYPKLYSLLGARFGGNGTSTFALPNLNGRTVTCISQTFDEVGTVGGSETVTLTTDEIPQHTHLVNASNLPAEDVLNQNNDYLAEFAYNVTAYIGDDANIALNPKTVSFTGGGQPHENRMPFMVMNFYIATDGIYPQRQ